MAINPLLLTIITWPRQVLSRLRSCGRPNCAVMAVRGTLLIAVGTGAALVCLAAIGRPGCPLLLSRRKICRARSCCDHAVLGMFPACCLMPIEAAMVRAPTGPHDAGRFDRAAGDDRRHGRATRLVVGLGTEWAYALAISSGRAGAVQWYDFWKLNQARQLLIRITWLD